MEASRLPVPSCGNCWFISAYLARFFAKSRVCPVGDVGKALLHDEAD